MIRDKYERMNATWPSPLPTLTEHEAHRAGKRLYRFATGKAMKFKWTFKRWDTLVHGVSHYANRRLNPTHAPHAPSHLQLERAMIAYVIEQGWLSGSLKKAEKPKTDVQAERHRRILARIAAWEAKAKRAATALKKLNRQRAYYDRTLLSPNHETGK